MKTFNKIFIFSILINFGAWIAPQKVNAQVVTVSFQVFYDDLSPYGTWINNPTYGYVWIPNEAPGFSPYATNGYWAYTDYGWTWVSYYPWGWAPFHYGRWYSDPFYGPIWVPDNEWGPGWVNWRSSESYYGWCAMGPGSYYGQDDDWRFVEVNNFGSTTINNYYISTTNNTTIINNSVIVNNSHTDNSNHVTYNSGPDKGEVEKRSGKPITPVVVKESNTHAQTVNNGQLNIYKPQVQKNNATGAKPAPAKVVDVKDVKTIEQRKTEAQKQNEKPQEKTTPQQKPQEKAAPQQKPQEKAAPQQKPQEKAAPQQKPQEKPAPQQKPKEKAAPQQKPQEKPAPQQKPQQNPAPQQKPAPQPRQPRSPKPH